MSATPASTAVGNVTPENERILILAPFGRDAVLIRNELTAAGFHAEICHSIDLLCASIEGEPGAALIAEEALTKSAVAKVAEVLSKQPAWSDFPLLVMTSGGAATEGSRYRIQMLRPLGNVTLLERPLRPITLISAVRAALRARGHQYQLRDLLAELARSNGELHNANAELTRANRELEEFAYVASHDLQEPMRMINIYTQLIIRSLGEKVSGEIHDYANFVRDGVLRMESLIRDLLTFSRTLQTERPHDGAADLEHALQQAIEFLSGRIAEDEAVIEATPLPRVAGDTRQLGVVFQNLISNSLKYRRPSETPRIVVRAEKSGGEWVISLSDNGIGFEQQYAERIFGLFKRLHKDEYPGTGLGLTICRRIVERYGGRMWAESKDGQGATFYFALPPAASETAMASAPQSGEAA